MTSETNRNRKVQLTRDRWGKTLRDILDELLRDQGVLRYATFDSSAEGGELPTGFETHSWRVVTPDGNVQTYHLDWDPEKSAPTGEKGYYALIAEGGMAKGMDRGTSRVRLSQSLQKTWHAVDSSTECCVATVGVPI